MKQIQKGFTLIELMIVVAIIGILAAVAIPAYSNYTKKAKFTEVVQATQAMKTGVEACYADTSDLTMCFNGSNGVPQAIVSANAAVTTATLPTSAGVSALKQGKQTTGSSYGKYVDYVVVYPNNSSKVEITAAAVNQEGLGGDIYDLVGTVNSAAGGNIDWKTNTSATVAHNCYTDQLCK